jgi:AhpD family alkylhydroperoxidase
MTMERRFDFSKASPAAMKAMRGLGTAIADTSLEHPLLELVKMRASQINGCAFCLDMHSKDARAAGESEQRLYLLDAWRETDFYSPRERAALAWTEALTLISETHAPDEVYEDLRARFSEREIADLTLAIVAINGWNRIAIGLRAPAGLYQPAKERGSVSA